eukprot:gene15063-16788_t
MTRFLPLVAFLALFMISLSHFLLYQNQLVEKIETKDNNGKVETQNNSNSNNRLLYMMPSYSMSQFDSLRASLHSIRRLCNDGGWNVTIAIQSTSYLNYTSGTYKHLKSQVFCHRINQSLPIWIQSYGDIGFGLNSRHRLLIAQVIEDFDYFIYAEEDMILTTESLHNYLQSQEILKNYQPALSNIQSSYVTGFLRYEIHKKTKEKITWEYGRNQIYFVKQYGEIFLLTVNLNQAIYIFDCQQILQLQRNCDFLSKVGNTIFYQELRRAMNRNWKGIAVGVSEWSSSFQHVLQCGMIRVIPIKFFHHLLIHHHTNKGSKRGVGRSKITTLREWDEILHNVSSMGVQDNRSIEE